jgi:omega-6 fatty acid desaturase (delta-12 desaturase)
VWQLVSTATLFIASLTLMYLSLDLSYWVTLALALPTAFLMIRLFIIQHDLGHGSFFRSTRAADWIGPVLGAITLTPYHYWKKTHAIHHATSGNLEHRGFGDIDTLTVNEYLKRTTWQKFKYRVYRHPLILFFFGAVLHFYIRHRLPMIVPKEWTKERHSIMWTNVGLLAFFGLLGAFVGYKEFLMVHVPFTLIACTIGVWLFYVQHQFEPTYWEHDDKWKYESAALDGSSYLRLPKVLQWLTGNIGLHHVHHLNARIPNYRLQEAYDKHPELQRVTTITLWQSFSCLRLALWDEDKRRLVRFADARR